MLLRRAVGLGLLTRPCITELRDQVPFWFTVVFIPLLNSSFFFIGGVLGLDFSFLMQTAERML